MQASKDKSKIMVTSSNSTTQKPVKTLTAETERIHPSDDGWPTTIERLLSKHGIQLKDVGNQRSAVFNAIVEECQMSVFEREEHKHSIYCVTCRRPLRYHYLDGHAVHYRDHNITLAMPYHRDYAKMRRYATNVKDAFLKGMTPRAQYYKTGYWR